MECYRKLWCYQAGLRYYDQSEVLVGFDEAVESLATDFSGYSDRMADLRRVMSPAFDETLSEARQSLERGDYRRAFLRIKAARRILESMDCFLQALQEVEAAKGCLEELRRLLPDPSVFHSPTVAEFEGLIAAAVAMPDGEWPQVAFIAKLCRDRIAVLCRQRSAGSPLERILGERISALDKSWHLTQGSGWPTDTLSDTVFATLRHLLKDLRLPLVERLLQDLEGRLAMRQTFLTLHEQYRSSFAPLDRHPISLEDLQATVSRESWASANSRLIEEELEKISLATATLQGTLRRHAGVPDR